MEQGIFSSLSLKNWINDNRHLLKPPVGNKLIWQDREFMVMAIGGPNERIDYHVNQGEEFFYQVEGDIVLKIRDKSDGSFKDITINEGEIFLLPRGVPHSPQRPAGTIGLVIERKRLATEQDGFLWYCEKCQNLLHQHFFHLHNIEKQLPPIFQNFWESDKTTCSKCEHQHQKKG